jgi:NifU-like protein
MKIKTFPWQQYSKKVSLRAEMPYCYGFFEEADAQERGLRLAKGSHGSMQESQYVQLFWLVDTTDGVIIDARFQAFGTSAFIAAVEASCEIVIGKNYDQARRITADFIDTYLRDKNDTPAFPQEVSVAINAVIDAIDSTAQQCEGLPLASNYVAPPVTGHHIHVIEGGYPGFQELALKQKLSIIDEVLDREVRPYIELDAGGVTLLNFIEPNEVVISYQGACTSCYSATGATLSYIQQVLRAQIHPDITVRPEL